MSITCNGNKDDKKILVFPLFYTLDYYIYFCKNFNNVSLQGHHFLSNNTTMQTIISLQNGFAGDLNRRFDTPINFELREGESSDNSSLENVSVAIALLMRLSLIMKASA